MSHTATVVTELTVLVLAIFLGLEVISLSPRRESLEDLEAAMREYLEWEINLVNDMASDDDHRFRVIRG